ncbi:MAG TPA: AzlC family ABC transporter permease [Dongiaceae bacterium]|nr:AzlC family ABC transporter permease [Dongiaceae bacterium]
MKGEWVFDSLSAARWAGLRTGLGAPGAVLGASFIGYGTLARSSGFDLPQSIATTAFIWALPGQIALVELAATGASLAGLIFAIALTNARLLPMTVTLVPVLSDLRWPKRLYYLAAQFIAVTAWTVTMQVYPDIPRQYRLPYFLTLGFTLWSITMVMTVVGYLLVGMVPAPVALGLVFLNPIYFMLMFVADFRLPARAYALTLGAIAGPLLQPLGSEWGLLAAGLIGGSAAFALDELRRRRKVAS